MSCKMIEADKSRSGRVRGGLILSSPNVQETIEADDRCSENVRGI